MKLPESISTEKSLLGSVLCNPSLLAEALELVPIEAFYDSSNSKIYQVMGELHDSGISPDNVLIYDKIKPEGNKNVENRLFELPECATSVSITEYCRIINEKWIRRKIIEQCAMLARFAENTEVEVGLISTQFENTSFNIGDICDGNGIKRRRRGQLVTVDSFKGDVLSYYDNGFKNIGVSTGWDGLDKHYKCAKGTLNIITGIPGHGKSEFIDAIMVNISENKDWKWAIFSPENFPYELHIQKIAEKVTKQAMMRGNRMSRQELERAIEWISEHMIFLQPDEENISLDAILKLQLEAIEKYGVDGCIVDPWNEIEMILKTGESETDYIGRSLSKIRRFARNHNIVYYIVAHPAKMYKNKAGEYEVPTMYNISGSAHWYNKADNGICIHRDFENNMVDIHIQKIKFKIHGQVGCIPMLYNRENGCFTTEVLF